MAKADIAEAGLARAMERFPEAAGSLRRLARIDVDFREICGEYGLAQASLAGFEARADAAERPEIGDYRMLIDELEREIDRKLKEAGPDD